jgi:hypothetical protein
MKSSFTFLCNMCLKISCERLLYTWKQRNQDSYLCGKCVYSKLNADQRAVFVLGPNIGHFYQGIDYMEECKEKSEYLVVVVSDSLKKLDYFSTWEPQNILKKTSLSHISKDPYYLCFGDLSKFYSMKPYPTKKFFRLKK